MTSSEQFAFLLKNSTLDAEEKIAILDILPFLAPSDIEEISAILKQDVQKHEQNRQSAQKKLEALIKKYTEQFLEN